MTAGMIDKAIVKSLCAYVLSFYKVCKHSQKCKICEAIAAIPEEVKETLDQAILVCKDKDIFDEIAGLVQHRERDEILTDSHMMGFLDMELDFSPMKFFKISAVYLVTALELKDRGFSKAVEIAERDIGSVFSLHSEDLSKFWYSL